MRRTLEAKARGSKPVLGTWWWGRIHLTSPIRRALRRRRPHYLQKGVNIVKRMRPHFRGEQIQKFWSKKEWKMKYNQEIWGFWALARIFFTKLHLLERNTMKTVICQGKKTKCKRNWNEISTRRVGAGKLFSWRHCSAPCLAQILHQHHLVVSLPYDSVMKPHICYETSAITPCICHNNL